MRSDSREVAILLCLEAEQESSWQVDGRKAARQRKQHMQRQGQHEDGGNGAVRADAEGRPE